MSSIDRERVRRLYDRLNRDAEASGYHLNPDREFVDTLLEGMLVNDDRYGYQSCPCRLGTGERPLDTDIICPCDYRDPDLDEFGACYCALYVSGEVLRGEKKVTSIPERRPPRGASPPHEEELERVELPGLPYPVWRCKVCGYLCARQEPPEVCPICKAKRDRFERFI